MKMVDMHIKYICIYIKNLKMDCNLIDLTKMKLFDRCKESNLFNEVTPSCPNKR